MWEFSINLDINKKDLAQYMFDLLRHDLSPLGAIVAQNYGENYISLVIAIDKLKRGDAEVVLLRTITLAICQNFKAEFLDKNLFLPKQDSLSIAAFKKALINFDKETDYFLISKALNFNEFLFLESFYQFKLSCLRDKWRELVRLANENREYLISREAFFDLIKFLIDNLDICKDEIDVFEEESGYYIYEKGQKSSLLSSDALIGSLIDLSPQKINLYYRSDNGALDILKAIFDRRINLMAQEGTTKKFDNKYFVK